MIGVKNLKTPLIIIFLFISIFVACLKYSQYETIKQKEIELNKTLELIESDLQAYKLEYNRTYRDYLNQKLSREDIENAIKRVLFLKNRLIELNASKEDIKSVDNCIKDVYALQEESKFYTALKQSRSCAITASDSLGSILAVSNRTKLIEYAQEELRNLTLMKNEVEEEWKKILERGVNFTDYMVVGLIVEEDILKAEIFMNDSCNFLERLQKMPNPQTPEEIENITILGGWVGGYLEFARSFLEDARVLMTRVNSGNFSPNELEEDVYALRDYLLSIDVPCNSTKFMAAVACDWKEYNKKLGLMGAERGYYSAAIYYLLYAIAINEHISEFKALDLAFNSTKTPADRVKIVLNLRHEALALLNSCPQDPITSLYVSDAVGWYFKQGDIILEHMLEFRREDPTPQPIYSYEMAKIIAKKMCRASILYRMNNSRNSCS
ncbi:1-deoxy-D-xylulose-5-phosphate synthase [Pyrococcus kukulkanii]|uniref:1-deoxy-D-xylulose-5-phosphate synthase n=1 Tax=Pyrococcus kukulkanii TaxID=1609559 RepID=UPI0035614557